MIWLDAHLSPRIARWIREDLGHDAQALRDVGLRDAEDEEIFDRAREDALTFDLASEAHRANVTPASRR